MKSHVVSIVILWCGRSGRRPRATRQEEVGGRGDQGPVTACVRMMPRSLTLAARQRNSVQSTVILTKHFIRDDNENRPRST